MILDLDLIKKRLDAETTNHSFGRLDRIVGNILYAIVDDCKVGELFEIANRDRSVVTLAEVISFNSRHALLTPFDDIIGLQRGALLTPVSRSDQVVITDEIMGEVLNAMGQPIENEMSLKGLKELYNQEGAEFTPLYTSPPSPMKRAIIKDPLSLGVRAIDGVLTFGEGQRVGIFAGAGVGKTTLMAMMAKNSSADLNVIALIGERGREVREFIEHELGEEGLARSIIITSTSDRSAIERVRGAYVATAVSEYYRDQGMSVLLMMDSLTRFARAYREIGLAAGEPPTRRGYPPSLFAQLPKLLERPGITEKGSITALYTVLVEGDDMSDPVADEVRSILDGHIILSRDLAAQGHYPAIDVLQSKSRVMTNVVDPKHQQKAIELNKHLAKYKEVELLVQVGEYQRGSDPDADAAIHKRPAILDFLKQAPTEPSDFETTVQKLMSI